MALIEFETETRWRFRCRAPAACLDVSTGRGWVILADVDGVVYILDNEGTLRAERPLETEVRAVAVARQALVFAVLTAEGAVRGLGPDGAQIWEVMLDEPAVCLAMDHKGRSVAMGTAGRRCFIYRLGEQRREELPVEHSVASVALVGEGVRHVAVADEAGRISLVERHGTAVWSHDLKHNVGAIRASGDGRIIVLPALDDGLQTLLLDGRGAGAFETDRPVLEAAVNADGSLMGVRTDDNHILLLDREGYIVWAQGFDERVVAFGMTDEVGMLCVALESGSVAAYGLCSTEPSGAAEPAESASGGDNPQEEALPGDIFDFEEAAVGEESATAPGGTSPPESVEEEFLGPEPGGQAEERMARLIDAAHKEAGEELAFEVEEEQGVFNLLWRIELPEEGVPDDASRFFLTPGGTCVVIVSPAGEIVVFSSDGQRLVSESISATARIQKKCWDKAVVAWDSDTLTVLDLEHGRSQKIPLAMGEITHLDCSDRLNVICAVDDALDLVGLLAGRRGWWRSRLKAPAQRLLVSPSGQIVLVADAAGRFMYFNSEGKLCRKWRFADVEGVPFAALEENFAVFASEDGRISVWDAHGRRLWSGKPVDRLAGLESFGELLVARDATGGHFLIDPYGHTVWEFKPPPGINIVRPRSDGDPLLVHGKGRAVTVFGGYRRKMEALRRFTFSDDVRLVEVNRDVRRVAVVAGGDLCLLEASE